MTAQPLSSFMTTDFIELTAETLLDVGFVSDEHEFAPYRETVVYHSAAINKELRKNGYEFNLMSGFVKHAATYAYYIYDKDKFKDADAAEQAVMNWLDEREDL